MALNVKRIAIGSDHAGFELKQHLISYLTNKGLTVDDHGTNSTQSVDYPEICANVARAVRDGKADMGIVLGGSGQGEQIAANKIIGIRAHCATISIWLKWHDRTTTQMSFRSARELCHLNLQNRLLISFSVRNSKVEDMRRELRNFMKLSSLKLNHPEKKEANNALAV